MDGALLIPRLFKYTTFKAAMSILENKSLKWSIPDLFNDPFEFKSPFEFGFEWDAVEEAALQRIATIATQNEEPTLVQGTPTAPLIPKLRQKWKGRNPSDVVVQFREAFRKQVLEPLRKASEPDAKTWLEYKRTYLVLCLSTVPDSILMWSHYTDGHKGAVLAFQAIDTFAVQLVLHDLYTIQVTYQ
jgi:hypothetical protein